MKKMSFIFAIFILGLLFQNSYSEEVRYAHTDSSNASLVLWKVHTTSGLNDRIYMTVDSVIKGNYYAKAQWTPYIYGQYKKNHGVEFNLNPNTYYLILALANSYKNDDNERKYILHFGEEDYILPDTPENREILIKKWSETKVIYTNPPKYPKIKGRDID